AAEPPFRRHDESRVHMHRRYVRVLHVGDQRYARGPEAGVFRCAGDLGAELRRELAVHRRGVDADLLEDPPAHEAHDAATAIAASVVRAPPRLTLEVSG